MDSVIKNVYTKYRIKRYFFLILGILICSCAYNLFLMPNNIVYGGVSGLSIIARHFIDIKPSIFMLGGSLLFCLLGLALLPRESVYSSLVGAILYPIFIELTSFLSNVIVIKDVDMFVICLFGGAIQGIGLGIVMKYGFTLGGTDFLTQIVNKYFKVTMGTAMLFVEGFIALLGAFVFGFTNCLYAIVILYLISFFTDKVVLGISDKKAFYIITSKKDEVSDYVIKELGHTITLFSATGGYSKKKLSVLFTVIPTKEYYRLKEGISYIDSGAFFTVVDAYEVSGGE